MAVYEYKCLVCETSFIKIRDIGSPPEDYFCEACDSSLKRVYSSVGVTFTGSGFYSNDK